MSMTKERWIQEAVRPKNKGKLRKYVRRRYGDRGFNERGSIKTSVLHELIRDPGVGMTTKRRAQFALNVRRMRQNKRLPRRRVR